MLETSNFVHGSAMWSLSLVMSERSLSGHGHGHVSNFYIVDFKNLATASRRYTGDIHNFPVVDLFMSPIRQWKRLVASWFSAHVYYTLPPTKPPTSWLRFVQDLSYSFCTVRVSALLRGNWQDFNWHDISCGPSAIAKLLVPKYCLRHFTSFEAPTTVSVAVLQDTKHCTYSPGKQPLKWTGREIDSALQKHEF